MFQKKKKKKIVTGKYNRKCSKKTENFGKSGHGKKVPNHRQCERRAVHRYIKYPKLPIDICQLITQPLLSHSKQFHQKRKKTDKETKIPLSVFIYRINSMCRQLSNQLGFCKAYNPRHAVSSEIANCSLLIANYLIVL